MRTIVVTSLLPVVLCAAAVACAQQGNDASAELPSEAERARELERATSEVERAAREIERAVADIEKENPGIDVEVEMRIAESQLAEAARRVAELSTHRLPMLSAGTWTTEIDGRPVLGVNIGSRDTGQPVEGVEIVGVTPGGAADEAGLRAGDVITVINGESLSADTAGVASDRLLEFMAGVEEGDELAIEFLRNGRSDTVTLSPRPAPPMFAFGGGPDFSFSFPLAAPVAPGAPQRDLRRYVFISESGGLGDMEMVKLTEGLGRYFGTDKGMLVVRAPKDTDTFKLQDGDVILDIDGREPTSVAHAVRILGSYQSGEKLRIRIMRDKRERTLDIEMPDERTGAVTGDQDHMTGSSRVIVPEVVARARRQ